MSTSTNTTDPLKGMTQSKWDSLGHAERERIRDMGGMTKQLLGLEGKRVEVVTTYDETRKFWVGRSTGWRPCHLEIKTRRSIGGSPAEKEYKSVTVIEDHR